MDILLQCYRTWGHKPSDDDTSNPEDTSKPDKEDGIGDINSNGKIDMTDYILVKRMYFGTYTIK